MKKAIKSITSGIIMVCMVGVILLLSPTSASAETATPTIVTQSETAESTQPEIFERALQAKVRKDMSAPTTYSITDTYTLIDVTYDENGDVDTIKNTYQLYIRDTKDKTNTKIINLEEDAFNLYSEKFFADPKNATLNVVQHKENGAFYVSYKKVFVRVQEHQA